MTDAAPTPENTTRRRFTVFEQSRNNTELAIILINELLEKAKLPVLVSWEFTPRQPDDVIPEELWLTLQLVASQVATQP